MSKPFWLPTMCEARAAMCEAGLNPDDKRIYGAHKYACAWAMKANVTDKERILWEIVETLRPTSNIRRTSKRDAKGYWVQNGRYAQRGTGRIVK